ncbi:MAG: guanylate kinase [Deltaproteobacteria bacterium]|nr:guanylate kinase [Deltaproteobacteria bacterium]
MDELRALSGLVVVLCGPSGAGKSTLVARLRERLPLHFSVSYTTRPMRRGEEDGRDYYFVAPEQFDEMVAQGEFLEHATVHTNSYGTHRRQVESMAEGGSVVVLDIDVQGAAQVRATGADILFIFILPPSVAELERRLRSRATDSEKVIAGRLAVARSEMAQAGLFDYVVVNDDLDVAASDLDAILRAERLRRGAPLTVQRLGLT